MLTLYFFRHGETEWNALRRLQGRTDIPLSDIGRAQAHSLGETLDQIPISTILASPLSRAAETAQIVASYVKVPISFDPRLVELHYGDVEGLGFEEVDARYSAESLLPVRALHPDGRYPNGETNWEAMIRFREALEDYIDQNVAEKNDHLAICAHGGIFRRFVMMGIEDAHRPAELTVPNCLLFTFYFDPGDRKFYFHDPRAPKSSDTEC